MSSATRQKLGIGLVAIAIIAAIVLQISTGDLVHMRSTEETTVDHSPFSTTVIVSQITLIWKYALPLIACLAAGLFCLCKPVRKNKI
jgi:hypothetical protein